MMVARPKPWEALKAVDTVTLTFERPPSVNALYRNVPGVGRAKTLAAKTWAKTAELQIMTQRPGGVRGRYHMTIIAERSSELADLDNIIKATGDLLKACGVIQDDRLCESLEASWRGRGTSLSVRVTSHPNTI